MMRHTGGLAVAAISTRSSPLPRAMVSACCGGMMPSCSPVSSITRISRTLMRSLTRTRSSRRGLRSKAIKPPLRGDQIRDLLVLDLGLRRADEFLDGPAPQITVGTVPHGHGTFRCLAFPNYQHIGDLLQLSLAILIPDLFLPVVELDAQAGRLQPLLDGASVDGVPVGNRQDRDLHRRQP